MPNEHNRILVTSALPYANGPIHLGHMAGAYLPADFYVRYKRARGEDVLYICGSDEHGVPITIAAENTEKNPEEIVEKYHQANKRIFERFGISFDYFGRTSSEVHHETARNFFLKLYNDGVFKRKTEEQLYDEKADMFLPDRYVQGTCPKCGFEEAYGDQCENCGTSLSPTELKDPKSALTGNQPTTRKTEHLYLPLGNFQDKLEHWLNQKEDWKPNVMGQCKSWLNQGLEDRAVTRDLSWGVPVPVEGMEGKVLYVWFDAPIGYISATKEWAAEQGNPEKWKRYWQEEDTKLVHFIGKDNIVFHCIMFPSQLMAHGDYILPDNVPANEFLNLEGRKFSTSRGWAVWLDEYLEEFEADLMRYVLGTIFPETSDADFSWKDFQNKNNNELADVLGNFINRTLTFTSNYFDGKVPPLDDPTARDREILQKITDQKEEVEDRYERYRLREALSETMELARIGNRYFTEKEPWKTRNDDRADCGNTLHVCLQISAALSILFEPVMPEKMKQLRSYLKLGDKIQWSDVTPDLLDEGHPVEAGDILFEKIEDEVVQRQLDKLEERSRQAEPEQKHYEPLKNQVKFNTFSKLDMRVGKIEKASAIPKADKLLKLDVDIGFENRTLVAGIAQQYKPDEIIGRKVCVVANLAPKEMMGVESQGMILMAQDPDGNFHFLETDAEPGSQIS